LLLLLLLLLGLDVPLLRDGQAGSDGEGAVGVEDELLRADHVRHGCLV